MDIWTILRYVGIGFAALIVLAIISKLFEEMWKDISAKLNSDKPSIEKTLLTLPLNFAKKSMPASVVSENGVTVAYQRALSISLIEDDDETFIQKTDEKIREILRANPNANLQELAPWLKITVSSVQRGTHSAAERLLTVFDTTIMYRFASAKSGGAIGDAVSEVQRQITEILSANPTADLYRYEDALGITITDVQRKVRRPTEKGFNG